MTLVGGPRNDGLADYIPGCLSYQNCAVPTTPPIPYTTSNAGGESSNGATVEQAEALLCQAGPGPRQGNPDNNEACWGKQNEFCVIST